MARTPAPGTRDRILTTATRLFRDNGVHAIGLQQIIDDCGCGKNLLYREFPSKDDLVAAYLQRCRADWAVTVELATGPVADDPAAQLVEIVRAVAENATAPGSRGCPLRNTFAEFPDPRHRAHQIAVEHFVGIRAHLHELAGRAGSRDPRRLADRIMLIIDGLYTNGAVLGSRGAAAAAVEFAREVVASETGRAARAA